MIDSAKSDDHAARLGADRFVVVLPEARNEHDAISTTHQIIVQCVTQPFQLADTELHIAARVGIALYPNDGADTDTLFRNAEAALKEAKSSGERYLFYTRVMTERASEKLALESRLRRATENHEFALHYQAKVDAMTRNVTGVEALIRWIDP